MENIFFKETVTSTNTEIKQYKDLLQNNGYVALYSNCQTEGRGRRNNVWESKDVDNIYLSIMMDKPIKSLDMITIAVGNAVCEVLEQIPNLNCKIKWPNDIYVNDKKLCGILVESSFLGSTLEYYIIGIGVNVNNESFEDVKNIATSIYKETNKKVDRHNLIKEIISNVQKAILKLSQDDFDINEYEKRLNHLNKYVYVNNEKVMSKGVDNIGRLIVEKEDGTLEKLRFSIISAKLKK